MAATGREGDREGGEWGSVENKNRLYVPTLDGIRVIYFTSLLQKMNKNMNLNRQKPNATG